MAPYCKLKCDIQLQALKDSAVKQLEQERSAQYVRDGEIATLRRSMEKVISD